MGETDQRLIGFIDKTINQLNAVDRAALNRWVDHMVQTWKDDRTIFVIGNGGSALNASHFAEDFGKSTVPESAKIEKSFRRIRIMSLTDNVGWITAIANDLNYDEIFVEQLKHFARPKDLLLAISVSGNSKNVVNAVRWANENEIKTFGLTGYDGGNLKLAQNDGWNIPINHMGIVEGLQLALFHWVMEEVAKKIHS